MTFTTNILVRNSALFAKCILLLVILMGCFPGAAQRLLLTGTVTDATTGRTLAGVDVLNKRTSALLAKTDAAGHYNIVLDKGDYSIAWVLSGFQLKTIEQIRGGAPNVLNIELRPMSVTVGSAGRLSSDSASSSDSVIVNSYAKESSASRYHFLLAPANRFFCRLTGDKIVPGNFLSGADVVKGLGSVNFTGDQPGSGAQGMLFSAMGDRYNQLLLNGAVFNSIDPVSRRFPLSLLPAEAIAEVSVMQTGDAAITADFAGGTVNIVTKDEVDHDFFYLRAGAGFSAGTIGSAFYGDARASWAFAALNGNKGALPKEFPTTRSLYPLASKNIQEQVYLSRLLPNNAAPVNFGNHKPDQSLQLGFGKRWIKKSKTIISLSGTVGQQQQRQFTETTVQTAPDVTGNPFPYNPSKPVVNAASYDSNYVYHSSLIMVLNASVVYRKSKISLRNFAGSQLFNSFSKRTGLFKPGEDTLASTGLHYLNTQQYFITTQLAGEHALGENSALQLSWQASYNFFNQQDPDERNLLLRQDAAAPGTYALAVPLDPAAFTNSGRLWRTRKDNNFSASVDLRFPFNAGHMPQLLSGGITIQNSYRVVNSDYLLVQGDGFVAPDKLLASERYFPGGVSLSSYYSNNRKNPTTIEQPDRGNYTASGSVGASWLKLDARLIKGLSVQAGIRAETGSQLSTSVYYQYASGFKNPQAIALDENTRITAVNVLPSAKIIFKPFTGGMVTAGWSRTINRPQLQELVKYAYYDSRTFMVTTGNGLLANAIIDNYTAAVTVAPNAFSHFTLSAFFKKIDQPIEYILSSRSPGVMQLTPFNTPPAEVKGIAADMRIKINAESSKWLSGITVFANGNISSSSVKAGPLRSSDISTVSQHELSGSPAYSVNAGVLMQYERFPQITVMYNRTGDYLSAIGSGRQVTVANGNIVSAVPDYRVAGREQLDVQVGQQFFRKRMQLVAGVTNLTRSKYIIYQDLNGNKKFDEALKIKAIGNQGGYITGGTDNTVSGIIIPVTYYVTLSCLF